MNEQTTISQHQAARQNGNRKIAFGLGLFAAAVFLSMIVRQWFANN